MAIPDDRLQEIIENKDAEIAFDWCQKHGYSESWSIIDGALVIFDCDDPPSWLVGVLEARDEDGNTETREATYAGSS